MEFAWGKYSCVTRDFVIGFLTVDLGGGVRMMGNGRLGCEFCEF